MSDPRITDLESWLAALAKPSALMELGALALCGLSAWAAVWLFRRSVGSRDKKSILFGIRIVDGVLFPLVLLFLAYSAKSLLVKSLPMAVFKIAIPVLMSLLVIRLGVKVLQAAFSETPLVRLLERTISWVAWLAMVLWVSGLLPLILDELDQITWKVGGTTMSVRRPSTKKSPVSGVGSPSTPRPWLGSGAEGGASRETSLIVHGAPFFGV